MTEQLLNAHGETVGTITTGAPAGADAEAAVSTLLGYCGYDLARDGLADTPGRVVRAWTELTEGEGTDPSRYLARQFNADDMDVDEMICLRRVAFVSLCEHHVLPFAGHATVAYLPAPGAMVVGVSKLARVVEGYAHRLQVQERLTNQIAGCLARHLDTIGVAVRVEATHTCLSLRGIRKESAVMVTSKLLGAFRQDRAARAEFFELARG
jgi:GTP cyclohydrolase I